MARIFPLVVVAFAVGIHGPMHGDVRADVGGDDVGDADGDSGVGDTGTPGVDVATPEVGPSEVDGDQSDDGGVPAPVDGLDALETELPPLPVAADADLDELEVAEPIVPSPRTPERDIRRLLRPEASILQARNRLDRNLMERGQTLAALQTLEKRLTVDLADKTGRFADSSALLEAERQRVRVRLALLARSRATPVLSDLLRATGFGAFETVRNARAVLSHADKLRIEAYRQQLFRWRTQQADLERRGRNLERTRRTISYLEQELTWDREERTALEAAVVREPEFYAAYAQEVEKLDEVVAAKLAELAAQVPADRRRMFFEETRGGLAAPIRNSDVAGRFGTRAYKGTTSKWKGAHFVPLRPPAEGKTEVRAIYWGWVAWTGWMQGLGQVIILDHTMGYWTVYGHLSRIDVPLGEKVKSGQTLGMMGDTESFFGERLYLELRKDGVAIDPVPWIRF